MQLAVLGYCLLVPIFRAQSAWLVLAYLAFVVVVAAQEATAKTSFTYGSALFLHGLAAIGGSVALVLGYVVGFVLCPSPWWEPQYLVPVAGMLTGNAISTLSLALNRFLSALKERSAEVRG